MILTFVNNTFNSAVVGATNAAGVANPTGLRNPPQPAEVEALAGQDGGKYAWQGHDRSAGVHENDVDEYGATSPDADATLELSDDLPGRLP